MSRVRYFNLRNRAVDEFRANVTRGYALSGYSSLQGGMSSTAVIPTALAGSKDLQFGTMVYIEDEDDLVPPWAGMLDAPWTGIAPVTGTFYNAEYVMNLRTPDEKVTVTGIFSSVLERLVDMTNLNEDLYLRIGNLGNMPSGAQQLTIQQTPLWGQINDFGKREGVMFLIRPTYADKQPLYLFLDAGTNIGIDTQVILRDGENGNMKITSANVNGSPINRVIGIGRESTATSRLRTKPMLDTTSRDRYRLRSAVTQFSTLTTQGSLDIATRTYLNRARFPILNLDIVIDNPDFYAYCRPGNWFDVHAANIYLPGIGKGWRGKMRMPQMVYDEDNNTVKATLSAVVG